MTLEDKYLIKPFDNLINSKSYATKNNTFNLIVGTTGLGKTYTTFTHYIPELIDKFNLDGVIFSYPFTEVFDETEAWKIVIESAKRGKPVVIAYNIHQYESALDSGTIPVLAVTHQYLINNKNKYFIDKIVSKGWNTAWFVDEPHTWLACSHYSNYADTTGCFSPDYNASLYKLVSKLSRVSPHIYGTTATPTNEHKHIVEPFGDMKFNVINEYPTTKEMLSRSGWMGSVSYFDLENRDAVVDNFVEALNRLYHVNENFGKRVMMVTCEAQNGSNGWDIENVLEAIKYYFVGKIQEGYDPRDDVAILTADQKGYRHFMEVPGLKDRYTMKTFTKAEEKDVMSNLNDPDHPCKIVLVIEKGKCGMNVMPLKSYFSFRKTDKKTTVKLGRESITNNAIQTVGRMMRIWTGNSKKDFVNKWGYDLTDYVKSLNSVERRQLLELNSYDVFVPDVDMWKAAINTITSYLNPTKTMAETWIVNQ